MPTPLETAARAFVAANLDSPADMLPWQRAIAEALQMESAPALIARMAVDGRAAAWRVRLLLFDDADNLLADTDPELPMHLPGSDIVRGIPAVAGWAQGIAQLFHESRGESFGWLSTDELDRKMKSLRPALSRNGGVATWKLHYSADGTAWKAVINIHKEVTGE